MNIEINKNRQLDLSITCENAYGGDYCLTQTSGKILVFYLISKGSMEQGEYIAEHIYKSLAMHEIHIIAVAALKIVPKLMKPLVKKMLTPIANKAKTRVLNGLKDDGFRIPKNYNQQFPFLFDWDNKIISAFGADEINRNTRTCIVDKQRNILYVEKGIEGAKKAVIMVNRLLQKNY